MSLAQHVTQTQGFDYEGPANPNYEGPTHPSVSPSFGTPNIIAPGEEYVSFPDRSEWRRLSFAPVDIVQKLPNLAAYKVSDLKRYVQVATGIIACWFAAGIVFGFAAIKPILIAEGIYSELCHHDQRKLGEKPDFEVPCAEQDMRLNLLFISASISANVSSLLAGSALDRFGRRACWLISSLLLALGSLMMGLSFSIPGFHGFLAGNILLAFGGTFLFVSSFQLANAFPKYSGLIVALVTGAFDASAAVFLFYRMAYDASGGKFTLDKFFFGYISVPVFILLAEILWMPAHSYHTLPQLEKKIENAQDRSRDVHASDDEIDDSNELTRVRSARADHRRHKLEKIEELTGDREQRGERIKEEEGRQEASGVWGVLHGVPAHKQMMSPWFILILLLTILQMLRMNYFIASVRSQYRYMLGSEKAAERINEFFDVALPVGGVASTPFIGLLLNNLSVPTTWGVLTVFIVVIGVLNCLSHLWAGYITVVAFVIFRPLYYSAISDYATKVFGFATFGRIYGTITCISGITQLSQSGLDALTHGPLNNNPIPINATLGGLGALVGIILTVFVAVKGKNFAEKKTEMEADDERERLLSNAQSGYGTSH
ncbi:major facilitator superfamily domain-containing protein [Fusarium tricinctum]|uniref:Major facilitator superfamily domain-containing protein n=1 Tax=Fusarium tricinctum TaxID=61284 RepID=A0A8K0RMI2_9HYPO|nr:major facilitator superfamily domain-containing protein [Fusarium tricinctum]